MTIRYIKIILFVLLFITHTVAFAKTTGISSADAQLFIPSKKGYQIAVAQEFLPPKNIISIPKACHAGKIKYTTVKPCESYLDAKNKQYTLKQKLMIASNIARYYTHNKVKFPMLKVAQLCEKYKSIFNKSPLYKKHHTNSNSIFFDHTYCQAAMFLTAYNYFYGEWGIFKNHRYPKNYKKAYYWIQKGDPQEDSSGFFQIMLAKIYELGLRGVKKDLKKALYWYKLGLLNHPFFPRIITHVGMLEHNFGDFTDAFKFLHMGSKQGDPLAMFFLAEAYSNGMGTIQNITKAYAWDNLALAIGFRQQLKQKEAKKFFTKAFDMRSSLAIALNTQGKGQLKKANKLAKKYYHSYMETHTSMN